MREIASHANVEPKIVIQYTVDGIPEDSSKIVLYGATAYNEFKKKLAPYEVITQKSTDQKAEKSIFPSGKVF